MIGYAEASEAFEQLTECLEACDCSSHESVLAFWRSHGANMGVDDAELDTFVAEYLSAHHDDIVEMMTNKGLISVYNIIGTMMSRVFYIGLVLGRAHPVIG